MRNLKKLYLIFLIVLINTNLFAQKGVLNMISNPYLLESNSFNNQEDMFNYRESINLDNLVVFENKAKKALFKISYILPGTSSPIPGFIDIGFSVLSGNVSDFDKGFHTFTSALMFDGDKNDYVIEFFKTNSINGGVFLDKRGDFIIILMRSKTNNTRILAMVEFNGLNTNQKIDFAKDFILTSTVY